MKNRKSEIPGKPIQRACPELRRVPQVRVGRPMFHLVEWMAMKHPSARIFLQHLRLDRPVEAKRPAGRPFRRE